MEPFKNMYNEAFFTALTTGFRSIYPDFDTSAFLARIYDEQWQQRELKQRMRHITLALGAVLPADYRAALDIMRRAASTLDGFPFANIIFPDFVEVFGTHDWQASLPALEQFTQQSSAEFAVRPFIVLDQPRMMAQMLAWTGHSSHHVRRLASEGCRPRLPWAMALPALKADPTPILPILEQLKADESDYVRRSAANNLNDIAKDHPQFVIDTLRRWQAHDTPAMHALIRHALRTLIKQGSAEALALVGYGGESAVVVTDLQVEPQSVPLGGEMTLSFTLENHSAEPQNLLIDYVVYHLRANGQQTPKVFKLTKSQLAPGQTLRLRKKHSFRPITTRVYYAGEHAAAVQINGVLSERIPFTLV
ncbi:MAG: DNA alkylation repair protein [Anaerolineae bacterium]